MLKLTNKNPIEFRKHEPQPGCALLLIVISWSCTPVQFHRFKYFSPQLLETL
jgi:hypothetical protein